MNAMTRIAAAALSAACSLPAFAADPQQSAIAGDPLWPPIAEVAPSIALQQGPSTQAATEVDPTWSAARQAPTALALHQEPLRDDPLQGYSDGGIWHATAASESAPAVAKRAPEATKSAPDLACATSCNCRHG